MCNVSTVKMLLTLLGVVCNLCYGQGNSDHHRSRLLSKSKYPKWFGHVSKPPNTEAPSQFTTTGNPIVNPTHAPHDESHSWDYSNFTVWGDIPNSECLTGINSEGNTAQQSPINIDQSSLNDNCASNIDLDVDNWYITEGEADFDLESNGHSIYIKNPQTGGWISEITYANGDIYCFDSFHFHWNQGDDKQGSEHSIDGSFFALEAHMVHYYCRNDSGVTYENTSDAASAYVKNEFVNDNHFVFAAADLFFQADNSAAVHPGLNALLHPSNDVDLGYKHGIQPITIDLSHFVPAGKIGSSANYYTYKGSLTTPPCSSTVKFIVFDDIAHINAAQLHQFETASGLQQNHRPVQNLKDETQVYSCSTNINV